METRYFLAPRVRFRLHPFVAPLRHSQGPVKQVCHVGDDLDRFASTLAELEIAKPGRREALNFCRAISDRCQSVAQESALRTGVQCQSGSSVKVSTCKRLADALPERRCQLPLVLVWATAISKLSGGNQRA